MFTFNEKELNIKSVFERKKNKNENPLVVIQELRKKYCFYLTSQQRGILYSSLKEMGLYKNND